MRSYLLLSALAIAFTLWAPEAHAQNRNPPNPRLGARRFYDKRSGILKNIARIHLSPAVHTGRISLERAVAYKFCAGLNVSHQFAGKGKGTRKAESYVKWMVTNHAPFGMYFYGSLGYARFRNHQIIMRYTETADGSELRYDPRLSYTKPANIDFSSVTLAFGLGLQTTLGRESRWVADYMVGYQSLSVPRNLRSPIVENNLVFGKFDSNRNLLGPASPLMARFSIGYSF